MIRGEDSEVKRLGKSDQNLDFCCKRIGQAELQVMCGPQRSETVRKLFVS